MTSCGIERLTCRLWSKALTTGPRAPYTYTKTYTGHDIVVVVVVVVYPRNDGDGDGDGDVAEVTDVPFPPHLPQPRRDLLT